MPRFLGSFYHSRGQYAGRRQPAANAGSTLMSAEPHSVLEEQFTARLLAYDKALSDGAQSLYPKQFAELMDTLRMIAPAVGRTIA